MENKEENNKMGFAFSTINYIIMGVGLVLLALGYILLSGGGSDDPNVFNPAMFDTQRLVVSPILIVLGFVVEIIAIMISPKTFRKNKENDNIKQDEKITLRYITI